MPSNAINRYFGNLPREVLVLVAVAFAVAVGFGIVFPAIPLFAKQFGVSNLAAGAVVSVFALTRFVSAPPAGWLVNRVGERIILATGIGIVGVSSALAGLSQTYWQLLALRGMGGVGSAMFTVSAFALLLRVVTPEQRGRASGAFQGGFLIGGITGPLFGAPLLAISFRLPFFIYAFTLLAAGAIGMVFLSKTNLHEREEEAGTLEPPTSVLTAMHSRAYWASITNNFATGWALFGLRGSILPIFVVEGLLLSDSWVGAGIFISALAQGALLIPAGHASDTRGRRPSLILGASLLAGTFILLATVETKTSYLLAMVVFGVGSAFIGTSANAAVGDVVKGRGGTAIAVFQMSSDLGAFSGPLIAGFLVDTQTFSWAFAATAGVCVFGALMASIMPETLKRTAAATS
ncbi:MAG TPA: MFS transporter [Actinomycetes bacterium]|nr:MFS transporter [Actinomycetes bacterium]